MSECRRCDRRDSENCKRRTFVYKCDCACHPPESRILSDQIHNADDERRFGLDREAEARHEYWNK